MDEIEEKYDEIKRLRKKVAALNKNIDSLQKTKYKTEKKTVVYKDQTKFEEVEIAETDEELFQQLRSDLFDQFEQDDPQLPVFGEFKLVVKINEF